VVFLDSGKQIQQHMLFYLH